MATAKMSDLKLAYDEYLEFSGLLMRWVRNRIDFERDMHLPEEEHEQYEAHMGLGNAQLNFLDAIEAIHRLENAVEKA
jgi:hypothetical protein